jgi:hypothetical protein
LCQVIFGIGFHYFPRTGFELWSSWSLPWVGRITPVSQGHLALSGFLYEPLIFEPKWGFLLLVVKSILLVDCYTEGTQWIMAPYFYLYAFS